MAVVPTNWLKQFEMMTIDLPAPSIQYNQLNVLMFGPSGHGKSSTANSILGYEEFPVSCDGESETNEFRSKSTDYEQYRVKIVDSPPAPRMDPKKSKHILKYCGTFLPKILKRFPKGCHVPVLVLKFGNRFDSEDEFSMVMLKRMFGDDFIRDHCVCVITHGDMFNKVMMKGTNHKSFNDWCREQKGVLASIFKEVDYRCVLFDNLTDDLDTKTTQLQQLVSLTIDSWPQTISLVSISPQMRIMTDIHALLETAPSFDEYQKQLQFLVSYTDSYNINPQQVQISVMIFGASEHLKFDFSEFSSHDEFAKKILNAPYLEPSSGTDKALALARQESFGPDSGSRPGVKQMALMITEGRSQDESKTAEEAAQLKDSGTQIMVIGVASVGRKALECLASDPEDVFIAEDYEELQEIPKQVIQRTCVLAPEFESTADILFILDSSGSIGDEDYMKELNFVVHLTECFNIGLGAVRFSVMIFSCSPQMLFDFNFTKHEEIKQATLEAPYIGGGTDTAAALDLARTSAFTAEGGTRDDKKIAIVITDGASNNMKETARAAGKLTDSGVLTLAIGVGRANHRELQLIASLAEDVYMVDNYNVLQTIQDEIARNTSKLDTLINNPRCRSNDDDDDDKDLHFTIRF